MASLTFTLLLLFTVATVLRARVRAVTVSLLQSGADPRLLEKYGPYARRGDNFTLECAVAGLESEFEGDTDMEVERIDWYFNDTLLLHSDLGNSTRVHLDQNSSIFSVIGTIKEDTGEYYCQVHLSNSTSLVSNRLLVVIRGIFGITFQPVIEAVSGETVELACRIDSDTRYPNVYWRHDRARSAWKDYTSGYKFYDQVVQLHVHRRVEGTFTCKAIFFGDTAVANIVIMMIDPPVNTTIPVFPTSPVQKGMNFELNCSALVNIDRPSSLNYTWSLNGVTNVTEISLEPNPQSFVRYSWILNNLSNLTELSLKPGSRFVANIETGHLLIRGATYSDAGVYTCVSANDAGKGLSSVNVSIEGAPEIRINHQSMKVGSSSAVYLDCPFISNPPPSSLEWKKGSAILQSGGRYTIFENNGTLLISKLELSDSDNYTCSVSNQLGRDVGVALSIEVIGVPYPPANFKVVPLEIEEDAVILTWATSSSVQADQAWEIEEYVVEMSVDGIQFNLTEVVFSGNVSSGVVGDLTPGKTYTFRLRSSNIAGYSEPSNSQTYLHPAPPKKPTRPVILVTTTKYIKISFSVEFGTHPITCFLINITESKSRGESQIAVETQHVNSLIDVVNARGDTIGYTVVMFVTGLSERKRYEFEVAANSSVGMGEFSEPSESTILDRPFHFVVIKVTVVGACITLVLLILLLTFSFWKRYDNRMKEKTKKAAKAARVRAREENRLFDILNQSSNLQMYAC